MKKCANCKHALKHSYKTVLCGIGGMLIRETYLFDKYQISVTLIDKNTQDEPEKS